MDKIWVLLEQRAGSPLAVSLELVCAARRFSDDVSAFTYGDGGASTAADAGEHGARRLYCGGDISDSLPGPKVAAAVSELVESEGAPGAILIGSTYDGRDIAARLSVRLDRPVLANVVGLYEQDGVLVSEHAIFGGSQDLRARPSGGAPGIYVVRAKSFPIEPPGGPPAELVEVVLPETGSSDAARVLESRAEQRSGPQLDEASVVVSGGRGLGDAESYGLVEELANLLNGAAGASRAIVDAGWVPYARQVGQTGKTVKPTVYIACGISGATQHMVGMKGAKNIIAINKDRDAPIFGISDLGVVGDLHKILPRLIETIRSRAG